MKAQKPILIFDGDCGFCGMWIERWRSVTGDSILYAPYQQVAEEYPEIPVKSFRKAVKLVEPGGAVFSGAEAVFRSLSRVPGKGWMLALYERIPFFRACADLFYRTVAAHRNFFAVITRLLWGNNVLPPSYSLSFWLFFRLLALIFLIAFASLGVQIAGLIGSHGILPAQQYLKLVHAGNGLQRFWTFPTFCWIQCGDLFLGALCGAGVLLSLLLFAGFFPSVSLFFLWALYLSLVVVGQDFLSFQWDVLLLETGFLAMFLAPNGILTWRKSHARPAYGFSFLLRWLLFRLMFSSGATKLLSGDPTWRNLTAMGYHYETQPLPSPVGWYAFHLPAQFQHVSTFFVLFIEIIFPFFIFFPRRLRNIGFWVLLVFQFLIALTGNYAFFNLLSIALCLPLLADADWPAAIKRALQPAPVSPRIKRRDWFLIPAFIALLAFSVLQMTVTLVRGRMIPNAGMSVLAYLEPFRTVNRYGLFSVMTISRPEILIQGSNDGETWKTYMFRYKPGDLNRMPSYVAPHQPRLDWQMWFAALETYDSNDWFIPLCRKLLEGSPQVLSLLETNPFPAAPPKYIRALVSEYHFTSSKEKKETGRWWRRGDPQAYSPVFSLRNSSADQ